MSRSWRSRLRVAALLFLLAVGHLQPQSTMVERLSNDPENFDTTYPANYELDLAKLPPSDPLSDIPAGMPPGDGPLINPESLDYRSALNAYEPSASPADYNPEKATRSADYSNTTQTLASLASDVPSNAEIILNDYGHPIFYDFSRTTAAFNLNETPLVTDAPMIPEPGSNLEKPIAQRLKVGSIRMALDVVASAAAVYNVLGSTTNPQTDMAYTLMPRLFIEAGTKGQFRLAYTPSFVRYSKFKDLDTANQSLSMDVTYPFSKLRVGASFSYQTQQGLFLNNQSGVAQQTTTIATLGASYPITPKLNASLGWTGIMENNEPGGEKIENNLTLNTTFGRGGRIAYGGILQVGNVQAPVGDQNYVTLQADASYKPDFHWRFSGRAGVNYRILDPAPLDTPDPLITPVFDLNASYHWSANAAALLRVYRYVGTDTFNSVNLNIQTGAELGFLLRAYRKTDIKFLLGFGASELLSNVEGGASNFSFVQGGLSVSYTVVKVMDVILFGNVQQRFADSQGLNYLSGTLGLGLNLRF